MTAPLLNFFLGVWNKCPWFIKWPVVVIVGPNLTVNIMVFVMFVAPWVDGRIQAHIIPRAEKRDVEIKHIIELQSLQNRQTLEAIGQLNQQQSLMFAEMIRRRDRDSGQH